VLILLVPNSLIAIFQFTSLTYSISLIPTASTEEKLADSAAANAALSSQLENIAPQLASLERALEDTQSRLELEQHLRRTAELTQDEAEARMREAEGMLASIQDECDAAHEELAFKESELEEIKLELEVERERGRVELEELHDELEILASKQAQLESNKPTNGHARPAPIETNFADEDGFPSPDDDPPKEDNDYVKRLEDELELVTEQLIETEQKLSDAEEMLAETQKTREINGNDANEALMQEYQAELAKLREEHGLAIEMTQKLTSEMELNQEELQLTQEELRAAEEDVKAYEMKLDALKAEHRDELTKSRAEGQAVGELTQTLQKTVDRVEFLKREVRNLEEALENSKQDCIKTEMALSEVHQRFDEARAQAEQAGRESAKEEVTAAVAAAQSGEISVLKTRIKDLEQDNAKLQQQLDDSEMKLAQIKDANAALAGAENETVKKLQEQLMRSKTTNAESETVKKLQDQLMRSKDELMKREQDVGDLRNALEKRVGQAEKDVARLEKELSITKGKLAEAEAHLIVSKREKARAAAAAPVPQAAPPPTRKTTELSVKSTDDSFDEACDDFGPLSNFGQSHALSRRLRSGRRRTRSASPTTRQRIQVQADEAEKIKAELEKKLHNVISQRVMEHTKVKRLEDDLKILQTQLFEASGGTAGVTTQMSRISALATPKSGKMDDAMQGNLIMSAEDVLATRNMVKISEEYKALELKSAQQREYNAQLLSKILSLQGNIQVCARVRPMRISELQGGLKNVVEPLGENELGCFDNRNNKWKSFHFDRVWGPDQTQQSIFQDVEPLALSVVDGYNACIFAYGQTGSGKTFTMEGSEDGDNYGISYRTIQKIFHLLNLRAQQQRAASILNRDESSSEFNFKLQLGMLEIYNDECYDLLAHIDSGKSPSNAEKRKAGGVMPKLDIRRNADGVVEVPDLTKEAVNSIQDVMALLKRGNSNRATAATDLNEHSSRSHMVLAVDVSSGLDGQPGNKGTLYLVDLAGSERVRKSKVDGDRLKEAGFINKSLSALGNVMEALDRKASHVPYRDSKLTYLLQDSLGGNSRTMMIVAVCPTDNAFDESVFALQFATRVHRIQISTAQRNVTSKNLEEAVKTLTIEMKQLAKSKEKSELQLNTLKKDNARIQERLQTISTQKTKSASESRTLEVLRKNSNEMAARWQQEKTMREKSAAEVEKLKLELIKKQTNITEVTRERDSLAKKLEAKETALSQASKDVRKAKDASSAANLRARKAQVIGSRTARSTTTSPRSPSSKTPVTSPTGDPLIVDTVRDEVMALLQKYDTSKVDRIDVIMEKFKGKEHLLVEKMKQRYEGAGSQASSTVVSIQQRSEQALKRHKDRMQSRLDGGTTK
jgi:chromosome segregation ATPase